MSAATILVVDDTRNNSMLLCDILAAEGYATIEASSGPEALERIARVQAELAVTRVVEHYMAQVPGLVAHMIGEMLHANGMTLKAPESWSETPAVAPESSTESDAQPDADE